MSKLSKIFSRSRCIKHSVELQKNVVDSIVKLNQVLSAPLPLTLICVVHSTTSSLADSVLAKYLLTFPDIIRTWPGSCKRMKPRNHPMYPPMIPTSPLKSIALKYE